MRRSSTHVSESLLPLVHDGHLPFWHLVKAASAGLRVLEAFLQWEYKAAQLSGHSVNLRDMTCGMGVWLALMVVVRYVYVMGGG